MRNPALLLTLVLCTAPVAIGADFTKANNTNTLSQDASWVESGIPQTADTAIFNNVYAQGAGAGLFTGGVREWLGLRVDDTGGTTQTNIINISNNSLTNHVSTGTGGIDMSTSPRDFRVTSYEARNTQTWTVASGATLWIGHHPSNATPRKFDGSGDVTIAGGGTVRINGQTNELFTGNLVVQSGATLQLDAAPALGTPAGTTTIESGGTLQVSTSADFYGETISIAGSGVAGKAAIWATANNQGTFNDVTLTADASVGSTNRFDIRTGGLPANTAILDLAGFTLTKVGAGSVFIDSGVISSGDIVVSEGAFGLQGGTEVAAFAGDTIEVSTGGIFRLYRGSGAGLPPVVGRDLVFADGSQLSMRGFDQPDPDITVTSAVTLSGGTVDFLLDGDPGQQVEFTGDLTGSGGISVDGGNSLALSGTNDYTGTTDITNGGLYVNGTHSGGGIYTVAGGATLGGDGGTIGSDVTATASATIDPGKGGVTFQGTTDVSGTNVAMAVDGETAGQFDKVTAEGALTITGSTLDTTGSTITAQTTPITIIDVTTGSLTGEFSGLAEGTVLVVNSIACQITYAGGDGNDVQLLVAPDPVLTITPDQSAVFEGNNAAFTVNALPTPTSPVTVTLSYGGSAVGGTDYTVVADVMIGTGVGSVPLLIPITDDGVIEGIDDLTVTLDTVSVGTAVIGSPDTASVDIHDGNSAPIDGPAISQPIIDPAAGNVPITGIVVTDEAGGSSVITGTAADAAYTYDGNTNTTTFGAGFSGTDSDNHFSLSPNPAKPAGYSLEVTFTPTVADVAGGGNFRTVWETGGQNNGSGIYLIDGVPHFLCKMNALAAEVPTGLTDTDWTGNSICVPLAVSALRGFERTQIAIVFSLDNLKWSTNGSAPVDQALGNRVAQTNWHGNNTTNIGSMIDATSNRGGLSFAVGSGTFYDDPYTGLENAGPGGAVSKLRFWNASDGSIANNAASAETVTASLEIRNWTSLAVEGELTSTGSTGDPLFTAGTWTVSGDLVTVNAALATLEFIPGTAPDPAVVDVTLDDLTSTGDTTGTILIFDTPSIVYVDDSFTGTRGDGITDGDLGTGALEPAVLGYNAFTTLTGALTVVDTAGTIIVNDGDYSAEGIDIGVSVPDATLQLTGSGGSPGGSTVSIGSLNAASTNSIAIGAEALVLGNDTGTNPIDCQITGTGTLEKAGTNTLQIRAACTFTGTTTVTDGILEITFIDASNRGSLDSSEIIVNSPGILNLGAAIDTVYQHSNLISGDGQVRTFDDGTVEFTGPANTFTGGFRLGDGAATNWNGVTGNKRGFVLVGNNNHLGDSSGVISAEGGQLQASTGGIAIPNNIDIVAGGLRMGGSESYELSGALASVGGSREYGSYGLEGTDITISGTIDVGVECAFAGANNQDNGNIIVTGNITGSGDIEVRSTLDNATVTMTGTNDYTGTTNFQAGTVTYINGTHSGGGDYTVESGATLGGSGSTDSAVVVNGGGTLAPGTSIGTLLVDFGVTFSDNSTLSVEVDTSDPMNPTADLLETNWDVTFATGVTLEVSDFTVVPNVLPLGKVVTIIDATGTPDNFFIPDTFDGLPDGTTFTGGVNKWTINYVDTDVDLTPDTVTLTSAGASAAYTVWADGFAGLTGGFDDDPDMDGVSSGLEWYFYNTDPTSPQGHGSPLSAVTATGPGTYEFTHTRPTVITGSTATYQWSTNLSDWTNHNESDGTWTVTLTPGVPTPVGGGYETVTVMVEVDGAPPAPAELFARLAVSFP